MQTSDEQFIQMNQTVRDLAHALAQTDADHERAIRRQRWLLLGVIMLGACAFYLTKESGATAYAQAPAQLMPQPAALDPQARAALREELMKQLPAENRQRLEQFEQEVKWVNQYIQTWDTGMEGAVVALMLYKHGISP
jgi:hypothetical protein